MNDPRANLEPIEKASVDELRCLRWNASNGRSNTHTITHPFTSTYGPPYTHKMTMIHRQLTCDGFGSSISGVRVGWPHPSKKVWPKGLIATKS